MQENTTLGHYRIIRPLGKGGMGEVYLAEDTDLKRQVALKVLPEEVRSDPERLARFRREAEAAAQLNHPNIAQVYAIEDIGDVSLIAMEYVPGQTLTDHFAGGTLALDTFYEWFAPLSDALSHAHEQGITHRDIKPGNIMIREDGIPKILDFGLARITQAPEASAPLDSNAPTRTIDYAREAVRTQKGVFMGTPAYMSPEQASMLEVDHRTDIFSFGIVMYEALTEKRPFEGNGPMELAGSVLKDNPPSMAEVRAEVSPVLSSLVARCLIKDRRQRYQAAGDLRYDLERVKEGGSEDPDSTTRPGMSITAITAAACILLTAIATWWLRPAEEASLRKFVLAVTEEAKSPVISPDGNRLAYIQNGRLWVRDLDTAVPRAISGVEGVSAIPDSGSSLFWSPNSGFIGYNTGDALWKVSVQGDPAVRVCELPKGLWWGGTWGSQDRIVFSKGYNNGVGEMFEVPARGGQASVLVSFDPTDSLRSPRSPTGDEVVFGDRDLYTVSTGTHSEPQLLVTHPGDKFAPHWSQDGHYLVYHALEPDLNRRDIWYVPMVGEDRTPARFTSTPNIQEMLPILSPDSRYIAYQSDESGEWEIWVERFPDGGDRSRVSSNGGLSPRWSVETDELFFLEGRAGRTGVSLMSAPVKTQPRLRIDAPSVLFTGDQANIHQYVSWLPYSFMYDVTADGQRFLMTQVRRENADEEIVSGITVVQNWAKEFEEE